MKLLIHELEHLFHQLLRERDEGLLLPLLSLFREKLKEIENEMRDDTVGAIEQSSLLFIEIFQFQRLSTHVIWDQVPKLYSYIGRFMNQRNAHENEFRLKVINDEIGIHLLFIE